LPATCARTAPGFRPRAKRWRGTQSVPCLHSSACCFITGQRAHRVDTKTGSGVSGQTQFSLPPTVQHPTMMHGSWHASRGRSNAACGCSPASNMMVLPWNTLRLASSMPCAPAASWQTQAQAQGMPHEEWRHGMLHMLPCECPCQRVAMLHMFPCEWYLPGRGNACGSQCWCGPYEPLAPISSATALRMGPD
jgi:hypothetical protein